MAADPTSDSPADSPLVAAALDCFATFGVRKASLSDVAERGGVSRATAYRTFGDKDGLIDAVIRAEVDRFLGDLDAAVDWTTPLAQGLRAAVTFTLGYLQQHQVLQRVLAREPDQLIDVVITRPGRTSIIDLIRPAAVARLRQTRDLAALGVPVDQAAEWMIRTALSLLLIPTTTLPDPDSVADLILNGITNPAR